MSATSYEALMALILTIDKAVLSYLLPTTLMFSIAIVAFFSKKRRVLELIALLIITYVLMLVASGLVFHFLLDRPFLRLEVVSFP